MNTRVLVLLSLFIGIGAVLHAVIPGYGSGMKPDMLLIMMFLGLLLFPQANYAVVLGIVTGLISGLTTTFPGGFLPNMVDKIITSLVIVLVIIALKKYSQNVVFAAIITAVGTIVSGIIFLTAALAIVGLPAGFMVLFVAVVLPATVLNTIAMVVLHPIVQQILRRTTLVPQM
ncbi:tryptophan transporter [Bacillus sp. HMF5848]|uniref:tryptophan transporter n=1 Tax=Bacillus sp. HMF5848 TaxID=2495421 RepID=UPI000F775773|nr:tryptophan transporter [Bacillus sp. HMF5848]RSK29260.1 tryptophan transporter [Bacillus sp. HMF5848]